jgi:hypothetical protein
MQGDGSLHTCAAADARHRLAWSSCLIPRGASSLDQWLQRLIEWLHPPKGVARTKPRPKTSRRRGRVSQNLHARDVRGAGVARRDGGQHRQRLAEPPVLVRPARVLAPARPQRVLPPGRAVQVQQHLHATRRGSHANGCGSSCRVTRKLHRWNRSRGESPNGHNTPVPARHAHARALHRGITAPPPHRTKRTRRVLHPVSIGRAASLNPY